MVPDEERVTVPEAQALRAAGVDLILPATDLVCDPDRCLAERDGVPVYSDTNHLSKQFVLSHVAEVRQLMARGLGLA
jgi:hypothetical protein